MAEEPLPRPILPPVVTTAGQTTVIVSGGLRVVCSDPKVTVVTE